MNQRNIDKLTIRNQKNYIMKNKILSHISDTEYSEEVEITSNGGKPTIQKLTIELSEGDKEKLFAIRTLKSMDDFMANKKVLSNGIITEYSLCTRNVYYKHINI